MEIKMETTHIRIRKSTKKELESLAYYGDTHDDIISKLLKIQTNKEEMGL